MKVSKHEKVELYELFVGMTDKDNGKQLIDTERIGRLVGSVCKGNRVSFSQSARNGGYYLHTESGERFISESSTVITLAGATEEEANAIAADLCCFLHQECVMVTKQHCERYYVVDSLDE